VWGSSIVLPDGRIDRGRLASMAFRSSEALGRLEAIVHPEVQRRLEATMAEHRASARPDGVLALEIPLLARSSLRASCDRILFVDVPEDVRRARLEARGLSPEEWSRREAHLGNLAELRKDADDIVNNGGNLEETRAEVARVWARWTDRCRETVSGRKGEGRGGDVALRTRELGASTGLELREENPGRRGTRRAV
jgi:dephospho-CoA kinase